MHKISGTGMEQKKEVNESGKMVKDVLQRWNKRWNKVDRVKSGTGLGR